MSDRVISAIKQRLYRAWRVLPHALSVFFVVILFATVFDYISQARDAMDMAPRVPEDPQSVSSDRRIPQAPFEEIVEADASALPGKLVERTRPLRFGEHRGKWLVMVFMQIEGPGSDRVDKVREAIEMLSGWIADEVDTELWLVRLDAGFEMGGSWPLRMFGHPDARNAAPGVEPKIFDRVFQPSSNTGEGIYNRPHVEWWKLLMADFGAERPHEITIRTPKVVIVDPGGYPHFAGGLTPYTDALRLSVLKDKAGERTTRPELPGKGSYPRPKWSAEAIMHYIVGSDDLEVSGDGTG